jgi:hypothetical protein
MVIGLYCSLPSFFSVRCRYITVLYIADFFSFFFIVLLTCYNRKWKLAASTQNAFCQIFFAAPSSSVIITFIGREISSRKMLDRC